MSEQDQPISSSDETSEQDDLRRANTGDIKPPQRIDPDQPIEPSNERQEGAAE